MKKLLIVLMITGLLVSVDAFAAIKTTKCSSGTYTTSKGCVKECSAKTGFPYYLAEGRTCVTEKECTKKGYTVNKTNGSCVKPPKIEEMIVDVIKTVPRSDIVEEKGKTTKCFEGQYLKGTGKNKTCTPCEAGYYCPDGKNRKKCPAGSYCPKSSVSVSRTGLTAGIVGAGAVAGIVGAKPLPCTGNTYSAAGQASCSKKCDGTNQIVNPNHTGCKNCTAKQQPNADHTACESKCTAGQYVKGTGKNKTCVTCEAGYYCPDGKNHQKCSAGTYAGSGATTCQTCAGNTYSAAGATSCKACPSGKKANKNHTQCVKA